MPECCAIELLGKTAPYQDVTRQSVAQKEARNVLILNLLLEVVALATNQGVVGSNPAGRATNQALTPLFGVALCYPRALVLFSAPNRLDLALQNR